MPAWGVSQMTRVEVRRARIEEIRDLAHRYRDESCEKSADGRPWDPPVPQGGIFWKAVRDGHDVGYAAGTLRPSGLTVGPVYAVPEARREGIGAVLLDALQAWAVATRVPIVEISVAADNPDGQAFLAQLGYRPRRILMSLRPDQADDPDPQDEVADL